MYHWISSQAFELRPRKLPRIRLPVLTRHEISTSQIAMVPNLSLIASMTRLAFSRPSTHVPSKSRHGPAAVGYCPEGVMAERLSAAKLGDPAELGPGLSPGPLAG